VRDALAIASVFDTAIDDHASGAVVARWIGESDLLAGEPTNSAVTYVGNRSLWDTLAACAIELDRVRAALPPRSLIDDAMRELASIGGADEHKPRNAGAHMLVTVFSESTWKAMAARQLEFFRILRGTTAGDAPYAP